MDTHSLLLQLSLDVSGVVYFLGQLCIIPQLGDHIVILVVSEAQLESG